MKRNKFTPIKNPQKISNYIKKEYLLVILITISGITYNALSPLAMTLQGNLIDTIIENDRLSVIIQAGLTFIFTVLIIQTGRYFKRYFARKFANKNVRTMRMMLYNSIINQPIGKFDDEVMGDLMVKAISDVDICVEGIRKVFNEVFDTGVLTISCLITLFSYDVKIAFFSFLSIPLTMLIADRLKVVVVKYVKSARQQTSRVMNITYNNIDQIGLQRINGIEEIRAKEFASELADLEKKNIKANILEGSLKPIYNSIALLGIGVILYFGAQKVLSGSWSVGDYSAVIAMYVVLSTKATSTAKLFNSYQKAKISWLRIKNYFTEFVYPEQPSEPINDNPILEVSNLSFKYGDKVIIDSLSFSACKGEIIGVSGPIGCGKTTLAQLLAGRYDYEGSIKIDHQELKAMSKIDITQKIARTFHQPQLLSDTIYHNIVLGNDGNIDDVLKDVCMDDDLSRMEAGIDTLCGNGGVKLSGGQQARIALARALYANSEVLILDDPLSAVDMKNEAIIFDNLRKKYADKIIIFISHRLATFALMDKVILMEKGQCMVETHQELLKSSSTYNSLYNLQKGNDNHE